MPRGGKTPHSGLSISLNIFLAHLGFICLTFGIFLSLLGPRHSWNFLKYTRPWGFLGLNHIYNFLGFTRQWNFLGFSRSRSFSRFSRPPVVSSRSEISRPPAARLMLDSREFQTKGKWHKERCAWEMRTGYLKIPAEIEHLPPAWLHTFSATRMETSPNLRMSPHSNTQAILKTHKQTSWCLLDFVFITGLWSYAA